VSAKSADKKQKKRPRLIGGLDMGLTRPLGQPKVSLIFALLIFFFSHPHDYNHKKKAPREVMQASAKGERRSDFDWPWRYSETILIWTKKELKEPKPKTCFVLTQTRRIVVSSLLTSSFIHTILPLHVSSFHLGASCTG
jgi:hypothetical protein